MDPTDPNRANTDATQGWSVTSTLDDDRLTLALHGEVDLHTASNVEIEAMLPEADFSASNVSLDLAGVTFMDTAGMGLVLRLSQRARELGAETEITSWPQHVGLFGDPPVEPKSH